MNGTHIQAIAIGFVAMVLTLPIFTVERNGMNPSAAEIESRIVILSERYSHRLDLWTGEPLADEIVDQLDREDRLAEINQQNARKKIH